MRNFHTIIIHCAATYPDWMAGSTAKEKRDEIDRWHKARGWKGIGYHYVIDRDGTVVTGRHLGTTGAHVKGHNTGSVGVCLVGGRWPDGRWGVKTDDFADHFTPEQDRALRGLLTDLSERYPAIKHIKGHNDYTDTKGCPSFTVSDWLKGGRVRPPKPPTSPRAPIAPPPAPKKPQTGTWAGAGIFALIAALIAWLGFGG